MQQTHLELIPYHESHYDDWLDLAASFSIAYKETFFIWNERPNQLSDGLSYLLYADKKLLGSIDLKKTDLGYECVQWALQIDSPEILPVLLQKTAALCLKPILIKVASRELSSALLATGGVLMDVSYSYFIRGDVYQDLLQEDAFSDHYLCIANSEKYKTINNSDALVRKEFMKPIMHNLIKFNLP